MHSLPVEDFSLKHTLESGQFFSYEEYHGWYYIMMPQNVFKVQQKNGRIYYDNISEKDLKQFLGLEVPYKDIILQLQKDNILRKYIASCYGLRIMQINPWQCMVSFICSTASNISKIRRTLRLMSQKFGKKVYYDNRKFFLFPQQGSLGKLKDTGAGFRAKYLAKANKLPKSFFSSLNNLPYDETRLKLCQLQGIGKKVADCILLFGYNKYEAFPVDVWIKRVVEHHYCNGKEKSIQQVQELVKVLFPHYSGYAQQFLYHGFRSAQLK